MDGQLIGKPLDSWMNGQNGCVNKQMNGWTLEWTADRIPRQLIGWIHGQLGGWQTGWMDGTCTGMSVWMDN